MGLNAAADYTQASETTKPRSSVLPMQRAAATPSASGIPNSNGSVVASGRERPAIRTEGDAIHLRWQTVEGQQLPPGRHVPQPYAFVQSAGGQRLAIGRKGNR